MSPPTDPFSLALHAHRAGDLARAEQLCRQLVQDQPGHAGAWHVLAVVATQRGQPGPTLELVERALTLQPGDAAMHLSRGIALQFLGRKGEAVACFREALRLAPRLPHAHNNLANALFEQGDAGQAVEHWRQALAAQPDYADARRNLAHALAASGHADEALTHAREALRLSPADAVSHRTVGHVLAGRRDWPGAEAAYREALRHRPQSPDVHCDLAHALQKQGRLAEAAAQIQLAVQLRPDYPEAYNEFGIVRGKEGQPAEAVLHFEHALRLRPDYAEARHNLAVVLKGQRKRQEAAEHFRQVLRLRPDTVEAATALADLLREQGQTDEALDVLRGVLSRVPATAALHCGLGTVLANRGRVKEAVASFREAMRLRPDDPVAHSCLLEALNYDPDVGPDELFAEHRRWGELHGKVPVLGPAPGHGRDPNRRLRVGYVSGDFRQHIASHFIEPILAHHDPPKVEAVCYADIATPDARTAQLQALAHRWRPISGRSDDEVARQVREDGIDVLVDLMGHTGARLGVFARKPAPVQVTYLGYPNTTGLEAIQYRLTDDVCDPPGEPERHTESLVRLPGGFCCYAPPADAPDVGPLPALRNGFLTFGATHKLAKLNGRVLDGWAELLRAVPAARLLVFRDALQGSVEDALRGEFARRGVEAERLLLRHAVAPGQPLLSLYHDMDILLDTLPWCGHATACEALWMGVPVLTVYGNRHAGRMTASVLGQIGLSEWVARTPAEAVEQGTAWGDRVEELAALRSDLRERVRRSALCAGKEFTEQLEEAYRELWRLAGSRERVG